MPSAAGFHGMAGHHKSGIAPGVRREHHSAAIAHSQRRGGVRGRLQNGGGRRHQKPGQRSMEKDICKASDPQGLQGNRWSESPGAALQPLTRQPIVRATADATGGTQEIASVATTKPPLLLAVAACESHGCVRASWPSTKRWPARLTTGDNGGTDRDWAGAIRATGSTPLVRHPERPHSKGHRTRRSPTHSQPPSRRSLAPRRFRSLQPINASLAMHQERMAIPARMRSPKNRPHLHSHTPMVQAISIPWSDRQVLTRRLAIACAKPRIGNAKPCGSSR